MRKCISWSQKEDELIMQNYSMIKSKKWKIIANILKQNGFDKKETECRERYINHLEPKLDKQSFINKQQLELFYKKYEEFGPKWTLIQEFLPKKSQVQLKNVFYGNLRCFVKKVIKYFTSKTAVFVNKFDSVILQNLYSGRKNYKGMNFLKQDIKKMNFEFCQSECLKLIKDRQDSYQKLLIKILDEKEAKQSKHYMQFIRRFASKQQNFEQQINLIKSYDQIKDQNSHISQTIQKQVSTFQSSGFEQNIQQSLFSNQQFSNYFPINQNSYQINEIMSPYQTYGMLVTQNPIYIGGQMENNFGYFFIPPAEGIHNIHYFNP